MVSLSDKYNPQFQNLFLLVEIVLWISFSNAMVEPVLVQCKDDVRIFFLIQILSKQGCTKKIVHKSLLKPEAESYINASMKEDYRIFISNRYFWQEF